MSTLIPGNAYFFISPVEPVLTLGTKTVTPSPASLTSSVPSTLMVLTVSPQTRSVNLSVPSVTIVTLGVGQNFTQTLASIAKIKFPVPSVSVYINQLIGPTGTDATAFPLVAPSVTVALEPLTRTPDPVQFNLSSPAASASVTWFILPDPGQSTFTVPDPLVGTDRTIAPDSSSVTSSVPSLDSLDLGGIALEPGAPVLSHAVVSPSVLFGLLAVSVPPTALGLSVAVPVVREGLGQPAGYCLINDECFAYCLLTPEVFAYCLVVGEAAGNLYDFGTFTTPTNDLDFGTFTAPLNNLDLGTFNAPTT